MKATKPRSYQSRERQRPVLNPARVLTNRRKGSIYIMVLGSAMILSVVGISALLALRVTRRGTDLGGDFSAARFGAQSAIELGQQDIRGNPNWRQSKSVGTWLSNQPLGRALLSLYATDPADCDFANDVSGHVLLTGTAVVGHGRYKLSMELEPDGPPGMDCLSSAVHTNTLLTVNNDLTADAPISSNGSITVGLTATVDCDLEAATTILVLGTHKGTATQGVAAKETPSAPVFNYYIANALPIALSNLPINLTYREIRNVVLSPGSNPFGGVTHPQGMYLLDCKGTPIRISDSRIHGTLVILDPGIGSEITGNISWERFDPQLPALLVRGSIELNWSGALDESNSPETNFNPAGSPYNGVTDTDIQDIYPGIMKGLIFVSDLLTVKAPATVEGVVIGLGLALDVEKPLTVTHDPSLIQAPPPGFFRSQRPMIPVPGSWRQVVD